MIDNIIEMICNADITEALVKIGNTKGAKTICEPALVNPAELKAWMVERTLLAWGMFEDELKRQREL